MSLPRIGLSFHGIGPRLRLFEPGEERYWLDTDQFRQLLDEIVVLPDPGSVLISFDDGNASDAEIALPLLQSRGLTAQFFALTGRIGMPGALSESQVRALVRAGMGIGTHGVAHVKWRGLPEAELAAEIGGSRARLEAICGRAIVQASVPYGRYDGRVVAALRRAGFHCAYTTDGGLLRPADFLRHRTNIRATTGLDEFRQLIRGEEPPWRRIRRLAVKVRRQFV